MALNNAHSYFQIARSAAYSIHNAAHSPWRMRLCTMLRQPAVAPVSQPPQYLIADGNNGRSSVASSIHLVIFAFTNHDQY